MESAEKLKKNQKKYENSEKGKANRQKYLNSEKGKKARAKYLKTEKGAMAQMRYYLSDKGVEARRKRNETQKVMRRFFCAKTSNPNLTLEEFLTQNNEQTIST